MNATSGGDLMNCGRLKSVKKIKIMDSWVLELMGTEGAVVLGSREAQFLKRALTKKVK